MKIGSRYIAAPGIVAVVAIVHPWVVARVPIGVVEHNTSRQIRGRHVARVVTIIAVAIARIVARVIVVHAGVVAGVAIAIVKLNTSRQIGSRYIAARIVAIIAVVHAWVEARRTSSPSPSSTHVVTRTA